RRIFLMSVRLGMVLPKSVSRRVLVRPPATYYLWCERCPRADVLAKGSAAGAPRAKGCNHHFAFALQATCVFAVHSGVGAKNPSAPNVLSCRGPIVGLLSIPS